MAQTDALDVLGLRPAGTTLTALAKQGDWVLVPGPYLGANPAAGTILGLGANALFYLGNPETTPMSTVDNLIAYTSNRQWMAYSKSTVQTDRREWELQGDWRYYVFSQPAGGLGTRSDSPDSAGASGSQFLKFDFLRVHETAFKRVADGAYLGMGYRLDAHRGIEPIPPALPGAPPPVTSHDEYSARFGFDHSGYTVSGVTLNFLIDTRDHVLHPSQGHYALMAYSWNSPWLGSSQASQTWYGEYRVYLPMDRAETGHLLGFWGFVNLTTAGVLPYLDLPASGQDQRERSGRGYSQGRWRGENLAYAEAEYRFPLAGNGLLGGVMFANAVTASCRPDPARPQADPGVNLFDYVKPAAGAGLRLLLVKDIRMNLELDFAWGTGDSSGLYLNLFEIF